MKKSGAVFLDRDGTIIEEVGYLDDLNRLSVIPSAYEAIRKINGGGLKAVVISNQSGVARGLVTEAFVRETHDRLQNILLAQGAFIDRFYYCPHHPTAGEEPYRRICDCRKPSPGLLLQAAGELDIDLKKSYLVGDKCLDIEAARNAGIKGILVRTGYGSDALHSSALDRVSASAQPDFIASDLLEAVNWILKDLT